MSHILKKIAIAGAGKKAKQKPPIYRPPIMGELQYGASFSYAETLDLISDGPIEGLVNRYGNLLHGLSILEGIYLDDTPIAVSNSKEMREVNLNPQAIAAMRDLPAMELATPTDGGINNAQLFFKALSNNATKTRGGRVTELRKGGDPSPDSNEYAASGGDVNFMFIRKRERNGATYDERQKYPRESNRYAINIRAYIRRYWTSGKKFFFSLNTSIQPWSRNASANVGSSRNNAVYRSATVKRSKLDYLHWLDQNSWNTAKMVCGVGHRAGGSVCWAFKWSAYKTNLWAQNELNQIFELYDNNNGQPDSNPFQFQLAARALENLGFGGEVGLGSVGDRRFVTENAISRYDNHRIHVVVKPEENNPALAQQIVGPEGLLPMATVPTGLDNGFNLLRLMQQAGIKYTDATCPEVDGDGKLTGKMHGFVIFQFDYTPKTRRIDNENWGKAYTFRIPDRVKDLMKDFRRLQYTEFVAATSSPIERNLKYNFSNVLAEERKGEEDQQPLKFFNKVFIDHIYNQQLFGPFTTEGGPQPQRIKTDRRMLKRDGVLGGQEASQFNLEVGNEGLPEGEGSDDERFDAEGRQRDYSSWAKNSLANWKERAQPITHTIYNPNVTKAFITLNVQALKDTLVKDVDDVLDAQGNEKDLKIGSNYPTVLNIQVETGRIGTNAAGRSGVEQPYRSYNFRIVALIEGDTLIDIGNPDNIANSNKDFIINLKNDDKEALAVPFPLPPVNTVRNDILSADGTTGYQGESIDQDSTEKRYLRVTKLSFETNSVLLSKEVTLQKITEIIEVNLPYPFSAIIGTKLDSRAFGNIPRRSFDCKLKKVKVPSNYFPVLPNGFDKRYYETEAEFDNTSQENKLIYKGDWDGTFHEKLVWTDNPAWILYDLLTNERYGMGQHIDVDDINIWQLYKIGRFCDAVDHQGYFEGVTDGRGGKEPRYSCNIVFDQGQKIYDAINTIANIFRGRTFLGNSEINFVDDRPREPVSLFTNDSVKDGQFFYSNNRRDEQFNTVEVAFKDRFDNFVPKVEVIEDEKDIRHRGVFKKRIEGVGITSRAMARRVGQHDIFSKISENQSVAFTAGLESLLCQPGDLVIVEDELKTNKANFGKVLAVDIPNQTVRISNTFVDAEMTGVLTVFNPTGRDTIREIEQIANKNRQSYYDINVTGFHGMPTTAFSDFYLGTYGFSGYTEGYPSAGLEISGEGKFQQYAAYTGQSGAGSTEVERATLYYNTNYSGWVFASGTGFSVQGGDYISVDKTCNTLGDFNTGEITTLEGPTASSTGLFFRGAGKTGCEGLISNFGQYSVGASESEMSGFSPQQTTTLNVTGNILSTPSELKAEGFNNYGSVVSGFDRPEVLPFVKLGRPVKFEIKDASPFIYKVVALKEEAPNEYMVTATKYETGKFNLIEKNISIEEKPDTFSYQVAQTINDITYVTLETPNLTNVTTGLPDRDTQTFSIQGTWEKVDNATGYTPTLTFPNGQTISEPISLVAGSTQSHTFSGLSTIGVFNYSVNAVGNKGGEGGNAFFDSQFTSSGIFVVYDELLEWEDNFVDKLKIL